MIGVIKLKEESFEWGALARGLYVAMLWLIWIFVFTAPSYLMYYVPLLLFLGLGLRPILIKTGLFNAYQGYLAKRDERINQKLKKGYRTRNANKIEQQERNREKMRQSLLPKNK